MSRDPFIEAEPERVALGGLDNPVHQLIQLQIQLMGQQLALLSRRVLPVAPPAPVSPPLTSPPSSPRLPLEPEPEPEPEPARLATPAATEDTPVDLVQRAMADLLMQPALGPDENFFQAGGHSLLAARLSARLAASGLPRPGLRAIFEQPTARRLAGWLAGQRRPPARESAPRLSVREDPSTAPLSLMQQRLWFLEELSPGTDLHHLHAAHWLTGPLDREALQRAFAALVERQSVLRTQIERGEEALRQRILPRLDGDLLHVEDMSHLAPHEREPHVQHRCAEWVARPFDLLNAPLFRAVLFRFDDRVHALLVVAHHLIWDAWSFDVLYAELAAHYSAFAQGIEPRLPPLAVSYGDFAAWQQAWLQGDELRRQTAHWVQKLSPLPEPLDLPSSRPRPPSMSGNGRSFQLDLSGAALERLKRFAARQGTTLYVSLLALYALALRQFSGQSDLCIGTPVRGRESSDLEPLLGFFVNMLPMRFTVPLDISAGEWVRQVHQEVQVAFDAPDVPFEHLVRELNPPRDLSRPPLHQASFSFQDARGRPTHWGGLAIDPLLTPLGGATQDLSLWCVLTHERLAFSYTFNTDLFDEADGHLFAERLLTMVERLPDADHLPARLLLAPRQSDRARQQAWNATDAAYDRSATVHGVIAAQAERTPAAPAVLQPGFGELGHGELHGRSNRLARALRARGVARGARVGLCVERGLDMFVAPLAILKAGAACVPLDPACPGDRLAGLAKDVPLDLLVSESAVVHVLPWPREQTLLLDIDAAAIAAQPDTALPADTALDARPLDPACVICTAGSTGTPQPVVVHHQAIVNVLAAMARAPGLAASDTLLAITPLSVGSAVVEWLLPLAVGARTVLASRDDARDGGALAALIARHGVTVAQATPSSWRLLIESGWGPTPGLKALVGGDSLPVDLAERLLERCGELWNLYGTTETTVWSTGWRVEHPQRGIRIGHPIANTTIHILDERQQPCPIGVPGEICIGGEGLTLGYHQRPELTAERFIADPERPGGRLYRTGDRGRWCHDGTLEHRGRMDRAVDRQALPVSQAVRETSPARADFALPANATEQAIAAIWARLLNIARVGRHDNFFNLGGHSLLALRAVQEMQRITGEKVPVRRLIFESLGQIAAAVASAPAQAAPGDSLPAEVHTEPDAANGLAPAPLRFGHPPGSLYGVFHPAGVRQARPRAVLLCNPFGQEAVRIHRLFRVLADGLAGAGVACLRFDYHASGESLGDDHEADLDRWVRDVLAADALLRQRAGVQEVDWLAPRLASALAVRASAQALQAPRQLVLWEPVVSGARYVDHLLAVHASTIADLPDGGALVGDEEILGFGVSRRLLEQMRAIAPADYQRARARGVVLVAPHRQAVDAGGWLTALQDRGVAVRRQALTFDFDWTSEEAFNTALVPAEALNLLTAVLQGEALE